MLSLEDEETRDVKDGRGFIDLRDSEVKPIELAHIKPIQDSSWITTVRDICNRETEEKQRCSSPSNYEKTWGFVIVVVIERNME